MSGVETIGVFVNTHTYLCSFLADCVFFVHSCMFRLYVDGPFGSPSEEVFNYDVSVCVAGGIGVTPFACVLHTLL